MPARGGTPGEDEQETVEEDGEPRGPPRRVQHEVLGVGDDGHVRPEDAAERLVQPRNDLPEVGEHRLVPVGHLHDARRLGVAEGARPQGRARGDERHERPEQQAPPASRPRDHPGAGGHDRARRHEVRPEREAGEEPQHQERAPGRRAFLLAEPPPRVGRRQQHEAAQDEGRRVEGRGEGGEKQEVRRGAGHEHGRRQRRGGVELTRERVRERHQQEAEQEVRQAQRLRAVSPHRHEGQGQPRVERRPVGLTPERRPHPRVPRHEADDRGVAVHRRAQGLDPERHAHDDREEERERDRARRLHGPSCRGVSPGGGASGPPSTPAPANQGGGHGCVAQRRRLGPTERPSTSATVAAARRCARSGCGQAVRALDHGRQTQPWAATRKTAGMAGRR